MIRFLSEQSNVNDKTISTDNNNKSVLTLSSTFRLAASLALKHILDEKRRNREARRRRLAAAAQSTQKN